MSSVPQQVSIGRDLWPFFLWPALLELKTNITQKGLRAILVMGGRRLGKSTLLRALYDVRDHVFPAGSETVLVRGSGRELPLVKLDQRLGAMESGFPTASSTVLMDDIDRLLAADGGQEPHAELAVARLLQSALSPDSRSVLILSATREPTRPVTGLLSDVFNLPCVTLSPWDNADEAIRAELRREFQETEDVGPRVSVWGVWLPVGPRLLDTWAEAVVRVTGGHPALAGPACLALRSLVLQSVMSVEAPRTAAGSEVKPQELGARVCAYLGDTLRRRHLGHARRIAKLREGTDDARMAYDCLVELAYRGGRLGDFDPPPSVQKVLEEEGLAYRDPRTGDYVLPGSLLRDAVIAGTEPAPDVPPGEIEIRPDPQYPRKKGTIRYRVRGETKVLEIGGTSWPLLSALCEAQGEVLSIDGLGSLLHVKTEKGIRSAVGRLMAQLRKHSLEFLVENVWGKGYRIRLRAFSH
ncbi:MAG: helix-turn-helix domain-containing protein [Gemmatimonadetes bacterium]|nr:helix-turn-helix domain-containing protein [Gemmatimonadota bacterium]